MIQLDDKSPEVASLNNEGAPMLLNVKNLTVEVEGDRPKRILSDVNFSLARGEILGIVGYTGSGKSMTLRAIGRLLASNVHIVGGTIELDGQSLLEKTNEEFRVLQGQRLGFIPQQPIAALNPVMTVEKQFRTMLNAQQKISKQDARVRAISALGRAGIVEVDRILASYPFQLSGGLAQRVVIAMALCRDPDVLLADEPTTALDVTIQREILELLVSSSRNDGRSMLLVTHDFGIISAFCDRVIVLNDGRVVEEGDVESILSSPKEKVTQELVAAASAPRVRVPKKVSSDVLLEFNGVRKTFKAGGREIHAAQGVDFVLHRGETIGLIGESGSGKSTLGSLALGVLQPDDGNVSFLGEKWSANRKEDRERRRKVSIVFQDPLSSLDPRMTLGSSVLEPLIEHRSDLSANEQRKIAASAFERAHLASNLWERYPREVSGGQQQRAAIARAIAADPEFIVLDEPTASLDASFRLGVLRTLEELQKELNIGYILISHDMATIARLADQVLVLYRGDVVERGDTQAVLTQPRHPYTRALSSAVLHTGTRNEGDWYRLHGRPSLESAEEGCVLYGRCPEAVGKCVGFRIKPVIEDGREVTCVLEWKGDASE